MSIRIHGKPLPSILPRMVHFLTTSCRCQRRTVAIDRSCPLRDAMDNYSPAVPAVYSDRI
jgi:hypothetical protein